VGYIEAEGIDLGSAKVDLNNKLTVSAVKAALASSEHTFNNFDSQPVLPVALNSRVTLVGTFILLSQTTAAAAAAVFVFPSLSTSEGHDCLLGSHFDPCKKGRIEAALNGESPQTPIAAGEVEEKDVDFINEIKVNASGFVLPFPPRISAARVVYIELPM
jgi:hypothetical protein